LDTTDDEALARRIQQGDRAAFSALVRRHQDRLFRLATRMLRAPDQAGDAVQEVFLRAWTGLPRFRFRSTVFSWLYATLRNVCHELNRKTVPAGAVDEKQMDEHMPSPMAGAETQQRLQLLLRRLEALPQGQRDCFVLRVLEGMSVAETASALKCRPGTVKTQLHRAVRRLREHEEAAGG